MKDKPTGLVTFLFTDIEGSTRLAQEFPESLPTALEKHHVIMHKVFESNNGFVFEIVGDAFCCAFEKAEDASKAAVDAQINLANEKWDEVKIKIRIGIHSGNAEWNGKRYMGYITLARTARVMSSAYGEQIIISNDTYELAKDKIPDKISFRDLGERRLKDLKQPVKLFQILSKGLRVDFPPLKTLDARPNNLPVQLTSFIGREAEMKTVKDLLKQTHLLTLTGSGGAGKTRLALQIAADVIDDFANGVWFVELASLSEPAFIPQAIMKVFDIKEEPKRSAEDTLCDYLRDKEMLIIIDNCEHVIEPCAMLAEKLLNNSPKLKIIATSREALRCEGEQTHRVLSLEVPDPKDEDTPEKLSQYESVRLFIERALTVDSTFRVNNNNAPALAEICYQLDGIPLAIELAAARTKVLSVEMIYERLNDRFNLLTGGKRTALPRQQTLRALIAWSYDLLSEKEQILWSRLSVFAGGWTLEAAEEVCVDEKIRKSFLLDLLSNLTDKSIVIFEKQLGRYTMLQLIQQFGKNLISEVESIKLLEAHNNYYLSFAKKASIQIVGVEQEIWLNKLEYDHMNFQQTLAYSLVKNSHRCLELSLDLSMYWERRGYLSEGKKWFTELLQYENYFVLTEKAKFFKWLGIFEKYSGNLERELELLEKSLSLCREMGNQIDIADALRNLGGSHSAAGNYTVALSLLDEGLSICRKIKDEIRMATILNIIGYIYFEQNENEKSESFILESLTISRKLNDKFKIAPALNNLSLLYKRNGKTLSAQKCLNECIKISRESNDMKNLIDSLIFSSQIYLQKMKYNDAKNLLEESLAIARKLNYKSSLIDSLTELGFLSIRLNDFSKAKIYCRESLILIKEVRAKKVHLPMVRLRNLISICITLLNEKPYVINEVIPIIENEFILYKKYFDFEINEFIEKAFLIFKETLLAKNMNNAKNTKENLTIEKIEDILIMEINDSPNK